MKKNQKPISNNNEIQIPEDQIEVIEVAPENIHLESLSSNPQRPTQHPRQSQSKKFSFNINSQSHKVSLTKLFFGCTFLLLILLGVLVVFIVGITQLLQKLFSFLF